MGDEKTENPPPAETGVNLNEEVYSLFIFKIGAQSMKAAESYLKNRNWTIGSASGMREALAYIIQKKPQFVMVAADHPNRKVKIFPNLITQAFPVKVIAYSEGANTASMNALREMGLALTLFPPVSGPSIERLIRKINRDAKEEVERQSRLASQMESGEIPFGGSTAADSTIRLKGESATADDMQKSFEQARQALMALADAGDDDNRSGPAYMPDSSSEKNQTGYSMAPGMSTDSPELKAQQSVTHTNAYEASQSGSSSKSMSAKQDAALDPNYSANQEGNRSKDGIYNPEQSSKGKDALAHPEASEWETAETSPARQGEIPSSNNSSTAPDRADKSPGLSGSVSKKNPNSSNDSATESSKNSGPKLYVKGVEKQLSDNDTLIVKGSVEAMEIASTEVQAQSAAEDLSPSSQQQASSNIHCITVDSPRFSGYLVAALGKNRSLDKTFIETVKQRLYKFLQSNGESVSEENPFDIKIKEVPFEAWAIQQAEFLRKSVHGGEEIAMAFFPTPTVSLKLEASEDEKMIQISLDELAEDVALDFDLYIYMPENNKFLLYTPEGKPLYGKQKNRLKEKGLTHMHLRKDSVNSVKKYRAQNYLNSKIDAFQKDPKNKK